MTKQRTVLLTVACVSMTVCAVQTLGGAGRSNRTPERPRRVDPRSLRGLTGEQRAEATREAKNRPFEQMARASQERKRLMRAEAWKWALKINEQQWKTIDPIIKRTEVLSDATNRGAFGWGFGGPEKRFYWRRHSERIDLRKATTPNVVIERNKVADELVGLLEDENSKDEDIRKKLDQSQKLKERARKELALVKKELAALPMTARQEAVLLITCRIE